MQSFFRWSPSLSSPWYGHSARRLEKRIAASIVLCRKLCPPISQKETLFCTGSLSFGIVCQCLPYGIISPLICDCRLTTTYGTRGRVGTGRRANLGSCAERREGS